jgi:RimJ/RimL family protein N-acetyltransferase
MKLSIRRGKPVRLETKRFILSTTTRLAAARLSFAWTSDPEIMHPLGYRTGMTFRNWYKTFARFNNRRRFCFAITSRSDGKLIGFDRLTLDGEANATCAIIIGDRSWWGRDVVQETRTAVMDFAFGPLGCERVVGNVLGFNHASIANYQMLGFQYEGVNRKCRRDPRGEGRVDLLTFGVLADEWRERRAGASR